MIEELKIFTQEIKFFLHLKQTIDIFIGIRNCSSYYTSSDNDRKVKPWRKVLNNIF